jgi:BirA family biotin operon repressor/biotin-[acetyl-CoA-carboxylase] ligase
VFFTLERNKIMDIISPLSIKEFLNEDLKNKINISVCDVVESTNSEVKSLAANGAQEGNVVIALAQTKGRGRMGRAFFSPEGNGVYMSVLLRPTFSPEEATLITSAAAVAMCEAIEACGVEGAQIKWVNDIYINNKKVCGILTEAGFGAGGGTLDYAVLGVGINVYAPEGGFPEELNKIAGFVFDEQEDDLRNKLIANFLNSFFAFYNKLLQRNHIPVYREKCFVLGKSIVVHSGGACVEAVALDIDENCNLLVEYANGEKGVVGTGEISVRIK